MRNTQDGGEHRRSVNEDGEGKCTVLSPDLVKGRGALLVMIVARHIPHFGIL